MQVIWFMPQRARGDGQDSMNGEVRDNGLVGKVFEGGIAEMVEFMKTGSIPEMGSDKGSKVSIKVVKGSEKEMDVMTKDRKE